MTIGGHDVILPFGWEPEDRDRILRFFRHVWPQGLYEDALGAYAGSFSEALRFAPPSNEFFVYASQEAWTEWESEGASAANLDTMVHVIGDKTGITLVIDSPHGPMEGRLTELLEFLARNRLIVTRGRAA